MRVNIEILLKEMDDLSYADRIDAALRDLIKEPSFSDRYFESGSSWKFFYNDVPTLVQVTYTPDEERSFEFGQRIHDLEMEIKRLKGEK